MAKDTGKENESRFGDDMDDGMEDTGGRKNRRFSSGAYRSANTSSMVSGYPSGRFNGSKSTTVRRRSLAPFRPGIGGTRRVYSK